METRKREVLKTCSRGHEFRKSSDCPVCPFCWSGFYKEKMTGEFPKNLSAPALRALLNAKITTLQKLATKTEGELLSLHGVGPSSLPKLKHALKEKGLELTTTWEMDKFKTVDEYINSFNGSKKRLLQQFRKRIKLIAPNCIESMSYGMPGYKLNGKPLVYFAAFKSHVGFFPTPSGIDALEKEANPYRTGKGTLRFKLDEAIPWKLVEKVVKARVKEAEIKLTSTT